MVNEFPISNDGPDGISDELKQVINYTWPCLLDKICVDPTARYSGHLLLSYIIASRHVNNNRIILQGSYN